MQTLSHLPLAALNFSTLPEQLINGLLLGAIYALIALGYTMVYGVLKLINFAHGEVYMIGAYTALFTSYALGYTPTSSDPRLVLGVSAMHMLAYVLLAGGIGLFVLNYSMKTPTVGLRVAGGAALVIGGLLWLIAAFQPLAINLLIMLAASMIVCTLLGMTIERFAYRPMRTHSRIASLITAIGVSLLLQYGGALFLPNSPPPSISENVNPIRSSFTFHLVPTPPEVAQQVELSKPAYLQTKKALDDYIAQTGQGLFSLDAKGQTLKNAADDSESKYQDAQRRLSSAGVSITFPWDRAIMFVTVIGLMLGMTYIVLRTPAGRAMRAASLDFNAASLMGIDVNKTVTFTFILGSSLAGAGAMMTSTFQGTPLTTFYGLLPGVKAFTAAVLGGIGNIPGAVLGGLLMGVAENMVVWAGYSEYKDSIAFLVLIVVLLFRPGGLLGSAAVEKV